MLRDFGVLDSREYQPRLPCPRCGGAMKPSQALATTWAGEPEWPGDTLYSMSPSGPGRLIDCLKCELCGHSTPRREVK